jgi:hypothetical protein
MILSTINNKTAFCEHNAGVFHFNVLQLINKLSHIKMCLSALHHLYNTCSLRVNIYVPVWNENQLYLSKYSFLL